MPSIHWLFRSAAGEYHARAMRIVSLAVLAPLATCALGCAPGDEAMASPGASTGGQAAALASGGAAGDTGNGGRGADDAGAGDAAARFELCQAVCTTEAELPCPPDPAACLVGWCSDPVTFIPQCLAPYDVMLECVAGEPLASFECIEGMAFPKEETCAAEMAALLTCIEG